MNPSMLSQQSRHVACLLPFLFTSIAFFCSPHPDHLSCSTSDNYTATGEFKKNLEEVLLSLATTTPCTGFGMSPANGSGSVGGGGDEAFGIALCRGDVSYEDCGACVAKATYDAIDLCPWSISVRMMYADCLVRYSNSPFFGTLDDDHGLVNCSLATDVIVADVASFARQLDAFLSALSVTAIADGRMFATRDEIVSTNSNERIYGLVQCTRDLSPANCAQCLARLRQRTASLCAGRHRGGRLVTSTCMLLYDTQPFFRVPPPVPPLFMESFPSWVSS